ncbi:diacylglycerol O-acyltransferase, partial [Octopus vulgaris]
MAGPENVLTLDTKVIRSIMYWMPTPDQVPIAISFFTYAEQIRMAVIGDRSVLPNPEFLTKYFVFQIQMKMAVVQQELFELKMRLEARSGRKISEKDMRLIRKIEQLKEELRELLVELRKRKSEEEHSLILTN